MKMCDCIVSVRRVRDHVSVLYRGYSLERGIDFLSRIILMRVRYRESTLYVRRCSEDILCSV